MTHRRQFTAACKAQVVLELLSGAKSRAEIRREHQLAASVLAHRNSVFRYAPPPLLKFQTSPAAKTRRGLRRERVWSGASRGRTTSSKRLPASCTHARRLAGGR